jgi:hypothetical protein
MGGGYINMRDNPSGPFGLLNNTHLLHSFLRVRIVTFRENAIPTIAANYQESECFVGRLHM